MEKRTALWLTGLSGSGKSTIAQMLKNKLLNGKSEIEILDGDEIRKLWPHKLGFSKADRTQNVERVAYLTKYYLNEEKTVIVALISPYQKGRERAREIIERQGSFVEIYVKCSLEKCEERDTKGLYKKARKGEIKNFTGIDDPYEVPENPDIIVNTEKQTPEKSVDFILSKIL